ncbi:outer membrane beta-barrel protein, partial [uncultured Brevundimonas sp.]|uniref:outer membrane protein n=1 Tax=uncultured Brevundimonas sp. TaxID=213418 RepID=UPI0030EE0C20
MKLKLLASVAVAGLFAAGAAAAEPNGWYGAIDAGWHSADVETDQNVDFSVEDDWAGFARLGYRFDQNWRVELEGGMRKGPLGEVTNATSGAAFVCNTTPAIGACNAPDGDIEAVTLMVNTIYDFGSASSALRPFVGIGAGVNRVDTRFGGTFATNRARGITADDASTELAAQALAGVAWAFGDRGHVDLTYRYLVSNMAFDATTSAPVTTTEYGGRYTDHSVTLGLRYAFGA